MIDIRAAAVAAQVGLDIPRRDPLKYRRLTCVAQRSAIEWIVAGHETYWHAGNAGSKTEGLAHLFVACMRGLARIDGRLMVRRGPAWLRAWDRLQPGAPADEDEPYWITLPGLRNGEAWRQWVLVQSYDQAKDSSMRAYRKLVGRHPHEISWLAKGLPKRIQVRPDGWPDDDPETWSEVTFISQEGMTDEDVQRVQGARVHGVHCDEMPLLSVYEEILNRADANTPILLGISATPEYKHEWEPILERFKGCYGRPVRGRVHIQSSVEDNRALSLKDLHGRWRRNLGMQLFRARWNGEHVDVSGGNPFPEVPMQRMLAQCQPGRLEKIVIRGEPKNPWESDYRDILPASVWIERWLGRNVDHSYLLTADTSRGVDDGAHDPCELQVWDWTEAMLVCRFGMREGAGGYLDEDSLAILADILGREYNAARIEPEVVGNFGVQMIATLRKLRYPNIGHDDKTVAPGQISQNYGWNANPTTNGENVNALIKGLNEDSFCCWSRDVVAQWMDVREDEHGRPANVRKGARHHREAMVCAGRALHLIQTKPAPQIMVARRMSGFDAALRHDMGHAVARPGRLRGGARSRPQVFRTK